MKASASTASSTRPENYWYGFVATIQQTSFYSFTRHMHAGMFDRHGFVREYGSRVVGLYTLFKSTCRVGSCAADADLQGWYVVHRIKISTADLIDSYAFIHNIYLNALCA
jgi:hypothetical protein